MVDQEALYSLAIETLAGKVFGPDEAFGPGVQTRAPQLLAGLSDTADALRVDLFGAVRASFPEKPPEYAQQIVDEIVLKASVFCSFLPVGELPGTANARHLGDAGCAIGAMYAANTIMDRGDVPMLLALEQRYNRAPHIPAELAAAVAVRHKLPAYIMQKISRLARPEDQAAVLQTYDTVLSYEAQLRRLSNRYLELKTAQARRNFLAQNAGQIATPMALDAGVPSVAATLYAIYRVNNPGLPDLQTILSFPRMQEVLAACNTVARVGDDLGDAPQDSGQDPEWGLLNINLFNQYDPAMIQTICNLAQINDPAHVARLQSLFAASQTPKGLAQNGNILGDCFFEHISAYIRWTETAMPRYRVFLRLCKRILEISYVNMVHGDRNMIAGTPHQP